MSLRIIHQRPPNFEQIAAAFPHVLTAKGVMFCYGTALYLPDGGSPSPSLMEHERVHSERQLLRPTIDHWWADYIADEKYRFDEELAAHREEWRYVHDHEVSKYNRKQHLRAIARRLSGPLYGHMVTMDEAKRMIAGRRNP